MKKRVDSVYSAMKKSDICDLARKHQSISFANQAWERYAPLISVVAALLLLLLATPFFFKAGYGFMWMRVLVIAVPVFSIAALLGYAGFRTQRMRDSAIDLLFVVDNLDSMQLE